MCTLVIGVTYKNRVIYNLCFLALFFIYEQDSKLHVINSIASNFEAKVRLDMENHHLFQSTSLANRKNNSNHFLIG